MFLFSDCIQGEQVQGYVCRHEWERAAKALGCVIEYRSMFGEWPMRYAAIAGNGVEVGLCESDRWRLERGYLKPERAKMLTGMKLRVDIKSSLYLHLYVKIGSYDNGYAVLDRESERMLFRLPSSVSRFSSDKPLYEDAAMRVLFEDVPPQYRPAG